MAEKAKGDAVDFVDFVPRLRTHCLITKPVNGAAVAAGLALVEACDLVVAAEGATFSLREVKLGLTVAPSFNPCGHCRSTC